MNLPNSHFQDFPIELKEINPVDFPNCHIANNGEKVIITPNEEGYITTQLQANIDNSESNTVVINAGVGQGKTTAIIKILKGFYDDTSEDYVIIVAAPYVSLVQQYFSEIAKAGISETNIYRYEYIGEAPNVSYLDKKVHIITVNGILGNPGDNAFINSEAKRRYLNRLSRHCISRHKKVILIMDEIHDAIHNFKQEYIFNLWKWKSVLHKNIILSATYNEASKVVIEYLAELTANKIKIIESERVRISKNQSDLFLHFNPAQYYNHKNEHIVEVVQDVITRGKDVDILSYSKNLAENIVNKKDEGIGSVLYSKYDAINLCTSRLVNNNRIGRLEIDDEEIDTNKFDNTKCNVGTNFKTGISIKKTNHAFIIILPSKGSNLPFSSNNGIFSDGINSVIQALARQRKRGGEIHLILPPPEKFNYDSLPFEGLKKEQFVKFYNLVSDARKVKHKVKYIPYNQQKNLVSYFYNNTLIANINNEIELVNRTNRSNRLGLTLPDFSTYVLTNGEKYLARTFKFFGKDLSSYITYCAITNQFLNCNLKGYSSKHRLCFRVDEFQLTLDFFFSNHYLDEDRYLVYNYGSDMYRYFELKNDLFNNYKLFIINSSNKLIPIKENKSRDFELQLLGFIHRKLQPSFNSNYMHNGELFDYVYTMSDYFTSCIAKADEYRIEDLADDSLLNRRVKAFKSLSYFRRKLIDSKQPYRNEALGEFEYVLNKPDINFVTTAEVDKFNTMIEYLANEDYFLSNNIFEFKQRFKPAFSLSTKINSLYTILIKNFIITHVDDVKVTVRTNTRRKVKAIIAIKPIPNSNSTINLITLPNYNFSESFWENNTYDVIDGKLVKQ